MRHNQNATTVAETTFNLLVAFAICVTSITNVSIASESFGLYLLPFPALLVCLLFLPNLSEIFRRLEWFDFFALALVFATAVAGAVSPNGKTAIYVALYAFSFLFLGIVFRNAVGIWGIRTFLNGANAVATFALAVIASVEFWSRYLFGLSPFSWLPLVNPPTSLCGLDIPRAYAVSLEPTYLGWVLSTSGLVAVRYVWTRNSHILKKYLFSAVVTFALVITWSTATLFCIAIALAAAACYAVIWDRAAISRGMLRLPTIARDTVVVFVIATAPFVLIPLERLEPCLLYAGQKAQVQVSGASSAEVVRNQLEARNRDLDAQVKAETGNSMEIARLQALQEATLNSLAQLDSPNPKVGMHRTEIWLHDFKLGMERPWLGWGPGYNSTVGADSSLSLPIFVFMEQGAFAAIALGIFLVAIAWKMIRSNAAGKYAFFVAYASGCLNLLTQTKHFHTNLWIVVALFWLDLGVSQAAKIRSK